jgi:hypothetical protein
VPVFIGTKKTQEGRIFLVKVIEDDKGRLIADGINKPGIAVILKERPNRNWTCIQVIKNRGNSVLGTPICIGLGPLYDIFYNNIPAEQALQSKSSLDLSNMLDELALLRKRCTSQSLSLTENKDKVKHMLTEVNTLKAKLLKESVEKEKRIQDLTTALEAIYKKYIIVNDKIAENNNELDSEALFALLAELRLQSDMHIRKEKASK